MSPAKTGTLDLESLLSDIREKEAAGVFTAEGRVLAWLSASPGKEKEEQEAVIPLALGLVASNSASGLPPLERLLIEGPKKKMLILCNLKKGRLQLLLGREPMQVGLAAMKLKLVDAAAEELFKERS